MIPYNTDVTRALRWLYNEAPNIQSIINAKQSWYIRNHWQFWTNWEKTVFDIRTANSFGLKVWCVILGVPPSLFDFAPLDKAWAYGALRENYVSTMPSEPPIVFNAGPIIYDNGTAIDPGNYTVDANSADVTFNVAPPTGAVLTWTGTVQNSSGQPTNVVVPFPLGTGDGTTKTFNFILADLNFIGANFYGGGGQSVALLSEIKYALQLRYAALVSNGRQAWINYMLSVIFNGGVPFDMTTGQYFILTDATELASGDRVPLTKALTMQYQVGPNMNLSSQFINLLNNQTYGLVPQCAGTSYSVVQM